ncbi:hypothetical protein ACFQ9X_11100 [Catenulispora yoronensis]
MPLATRSHSASGSRTPPGRRQAMPTTATGSRTPASSLRRRLRVFWSSADTFLR